MALLYHVTVYVIVTHCVISLPDFQEQIPNGHRVPHPCFVNTIWKGVGHQNAGGGGFLNPFGEDFRRNNFKWDPCLCERDSDGDGVTNGQELGDPYCSWQEGDGLPDDISDLSHPGVCEPVTSPMCVEKNSWSVCEALDFECEATNDADADEIHLRYTETEIPSKETSYFCYAVTFSDTLDLHAFAMEPIIDNADLVHHIDLHACEDGPTSDWAKSTYPVPVECDSMAGCGGNMIAAWALGVTGICLPDQVGVRLGKNGDKTAILRIHYHNPFNRQGETDTSGMLLHVTENIRPNDAQVINAGQMDIAIPPGLDEYEEQGTCDPLCTNSFTQDVFIIFGAMHMHYLGIGGYSEILRDGEKVRDIMKQDFYDYNSPHLQYFEPPIPLNRGDQVRHVCRFQSRERTEWTFRGQSATDEMCHIYLVYYPKQNLSQCFDNSEVASCKYRYEESSVKVNMGDCDWDEFKQVYNAYLGDAVAEKCDSAGLECYEGCQEAIDWTISNHTCLEQQE